MLRLPKALPSPLQLPKLGSEIYDLEALKSKPFSIIYIAGAISTGCTAAELRKYLQAFDRADVEDKLSSTRRIVNHSVTFYAAWGNHFDILELLLEYGANPNMKGYAKMHCWRSQSSGAIGRKRMWTSWLHFSFPTVLHQTVSQRSSGSTTSKIQRHWAAASRNGSHPRRLLTGPRSTPRP